jgi:hypothetical protein
MAVFIYQQDALELLAEMEGEAWLAEQHINTASSYHFPIWREAWDLKVAAGHEKDDGAHLEDYISDRFELSISPIIYGKGGFHRYLVRPNGEILFSRMHSIARRVPQAQAVGFTLC